LWLAGAAVVTLLLLAGGWDSLHRAALVGSLLFPFLVFPWFFVVIILGTSPLTGAQAEALADGILSRPVNRWEFLLASWAARVATVLSVYLAVMLPAVALVAWADRPAAGDPLTLYGTVASLAVVALVLTFLLSLGFLVGTFLKGSVVAVVVLTFIWYPVNLTLNTFSLEEFSPISLNQAIPVLARQPAPWTDATSENSTGDPETAALMNEGADFIRRLSGVPQPKPRHQPEFFSRDDQYKDFALWRVLLGYGLPTLLAVAGATWCFSVQDL
jgi:hypothetical protein